MHLKDKVVVVMGGTGGVGEGIVKTMLAADATVIVPSRQQSRLNMLRSYTGELTSGKLRLHLGSVNDLTMADKFGDFLQQNYPKIDLAIASLGGWHQGYPLHKYPLPEWERIMQDNLTAHFLALKVLVPLLHPQQGAYFHINGFSAEQAYPMAGPVALAAAAQKSMMATLAEELSNTNIRVFELILGPIKTRKRQEMGQSQTQWYSPEDIGAFILKTYLNTHITQHLHHLLAKTSPL